MVHEETVNTKTAMLQKPNQRKTSATFPQFCGFSIRGFLQTLEHETFPQVAVGSHNVGMEQTPWRRQQSSEGTELVEIISFVNYQKSHFSDCRVGNMLRSRAMKITSSGSLPTSSGGSCFAVSTSRFLSRPALVGVSSRRPWPSPHKLSDFRGLGTSWIRPGVRCRPCLSRSRCARVRNNEFVSGSSSSGSSRPTTPRSGC